jgi:putative ABC transport system permease protein
MTGLTPAKMTGLALQILIPAGALALLLAGLRSASLPVTYHIRNVFVRWRATLATVSGIALVVAVFMLLQALAIGLEKASGNTGDPHNLLIARKGSTAESNSQVSRDHLRKIIYRPEIQRNPQGEPLVSADIITLATLPRKQGNGQANVVIRGVSPRAFELRPQVSLVAGRWVNPGLREVVVSQRLAARFANFNVGESFKVGPSQLTVVGWTDGRKSAFDSEVWMDADEARSLFDREDYSSVLVRPVDAAAMASLTRFLDQDKQLLLKSVPESEYYAAQSSTAGPIRWLGNFLATMMSIGAVFAAMNTMYASVGARTREIGTLRVLGYRRRAIIAGFLIEGAILALVGGILGCLLSLPMNGYATGTIGFETFSEVVFEFRITPWLAAKGVGFAVIVGLIGSLLPALRAARLPVISALKSV